MASSMAGISPMVKSKSPLYHRSWLLSYKNFSSGNRYIVVDQVIVACATNGLDHGLFLVSCSTSQNEWWHHSHYKGWVLVSQPRALTEEPLNFLLHSVVRALAENVFTSLPCSVASRTSFSIIISFYSTSDLLICYAVLCITEAELTECYMQILTACMYMC